MPFDEIRMWPNIRQNVRLYLKNPRVSLQEMVKTLDPEGDTGLNIDLVIIC